MLSISLNKTFLIFLPCYTDTIETIKKVKKECYLIRQDNTAYTCLIKLSFSSIGQDKSKLQKPINKLLILHMLLLASCKSPKI